MEYVRWDDPRRKNKTERRNFKWTPAAVALLREMGPVSTEAEIAARLGCSWASAHRALYQFGVARPDPRAARREKHERLAALIRPLAGVLTNGEIANELGVTAAQVASIRVEFGILGRALGRAGQSRPMPPACVNYRAQWSDRESARVERMLALSSKCLLKDRLQSVA